MTQQIIRQLPLFSNPPISPSSEVKGSPYLCVTPDHLPHLLDYLKRRHWYSYLIPADSNQYGRVRSSDGSAVLVLYLSGTLTPQGRCPEEAVAAVRDYLNTLTSEADE